MRKRRASATRENRLKAYNFSENRGFMVKNVEGPQGQEIWEEETID